MLVGKMINGNIYSKNNEYRHAFTAGVLGNLSLAILKVSVALFGYSKLILMDGIVSFVNAVALLFMWQGDGLERKRADDEYPYGYGKAVFITMFVSGLVVLVVAVYMFFYGLEGMDWREVHRSYSGAVMVAAISIIGNLILCRYLIDESRHHSNKVLAWNAVNNRIDTLVSSLILFFIFSAGMGALYSEKLGVIVISIIILFMSLRILYTAFAGVMDKRPPEKVLNRVRSHVKKAEGVKDILNIKARHVGTFIYLDLCIAVDVNLNMEGADKIARNLEMKLIENIPFIREANVIIT